MNSQEIKEIYYALKKEQKATGARHESNDCGIFNEVMKLYNEVMKFPLTNNGWMLTENKSPESEVRVCVADPHFGGNAPWRYDLFYGFYHSTRWASTVNGWFSDNDGKDDRWYIPTYWLAIESKNIQKYLTKQIEPPSLPGKYIKYLEEQKERIEKAELIRLTIKFGKP